jgi:predicted metal-dependent hydrolase
MSLRIDYLKRQNARRYILRLNEEGNGGCVTIPRGGSRMEARSFARRHLPWLEERVQRWKAKAQVCPEGAMWYRGEVLPLVEISETEARLGGQSWRIKGGTGTLRERLEVALWEAAGGELPGRVMVLAAEHGVAVRRVTVRSQRSRWGSCSVNGVVSLNWRLIQTPDFVRDYIIVHELMHLKEMNHSEQFWKLVYAAYPRTNEAERWLKEHAGLLRN